MPLEFPPHINQYKDPSNLYLGIQLGLGVELGLGRGNSVDFKKEP